MGAKWIVYSKMIIGLLLIVVNNLAPIIPAEWRSIVDVVIAVAVSVERFFGGASGKHPALTILPPPTKK